MDFLPGRVLIVLGDQLYEIEHNHIGPGPGRLGNLFRLRHRHQQPGPAHYFTHAPLQVLGELFTIL